MTLFRPRHIFITGGSRGIGLAIAQTFAKKSYRCTLISRSEPALRTAIASLPPVPSISTLLPDSFPHRPESFQHSYIAGDITQFSNFWSTSTTGLLGRWREKPSANDVNSPGRIDVLVNCAGVTQGSLFKMTCGERVSEIVETNLTAGMYGARALMRSGYLVGTGGLGTGGVSLGRAKEGREVGEGRGTSDAGRTQMSIQNTLSTESPPIPWPSPVIINLSSLLGLQGGLGAVAYAASKAGVLGFTRALASEYRSHHIRVNAIVPGYVETDMTKNLNLKELGQRIPLNRFGTVEEIAQAAVFLVENEYAHNCVINLDGGLSAI